MLIGIHHKKNSFSKGWISHCQKNNIPYKIVNAYRSDIVAQLADCDVFMWHYHHANPVETLFAQKLLFALEASGKKVYPNFKTGWFFDDKVGQKYLLEAIGAPIIPSYVFYSKKDALEWIRRAAFPKVFKLRRGSGSANVRLVKTRKDAVRIVRKAFRNGFRLYAPWTGLKERWRIIKLGHSSPSDLIEALGRFFIKTKFEKISGRERGYVYFQDFIEGCTFDIRVTIIGDKCFALKRLVRENDFRASGSHEEKNNPSEIPDIVIREAFRLNERLDIQSVALDFLIDSDGKPLLTEMSHAFGWEEGDAHVYWDSDQNLHLNSFDPFGEMVDNLIKQMKNP